ncbi:MAG TPA: hypothetical protein QF753_08380 [Victivallales bacterium]|nr:hypothetical protein [Victivallales bacterium]
MKTGTIEKEKQTTIALKEYFQYPIFKYKDCGVPSSYTVKDVKYTIGVTNPMLNSEEKEKCITLTMDHGLVLLGIFCFTNPFERLREIPFSLTEFCNTVFGCSNTKTHKKAKTILNELMHCWTEIEDKGKKTYHRILSDVVISKKKSKRGSKSSSEEIWFDKVVLSEMYYNLIYNIERRMCLDLSYVRQLTSTLAKTIFMYLPSRAIKASSEGQIFKISLTTLLTQVGYSPIPQYKSKRKQIFTKNDETSILNQLNKAKLLNDKIFKCDLEDTVDKKDYNLACWVDSTHAIVKEPKGKLYEAWKKSGGSFMEWQKRLSTKSVVEFNSYELDALSHTPKWETSKQFLIMAKCLLGDLFAEYIGAVKNDVIEDKLFYKTPGHALTAELLKAITKVNK